MNGDTEKKLNHFLTVEWPAHQKEVERRRKEMEPLLTAWKTINNTRRFALWIAGFVLAFGVILKFGKDILVALVNIVRP